MSTMASMTIVFVLTQWLLQMIVVTRSHVVLTFPAARQYALDFLGSNRLPPSMCGMPKGFGPWTSLKSGSTINITWNLAYPHKGGYKLEILDYLDRPLMDLTPIINGSQFIESEQLVQHRQVLLPKDFECGNCSIRLISQASEWGPDVFLRSCADVDIVKDSYVEDCTGNGVYRDAMCYCNKNFEGDRCQYQNECFEDQDCGGHGQCFRIASNNYPQKQCYCELGWFGRMCEKDSEIRSKDLMLEHHNQQDLSADVKLYWQLLPSSEEIEIVVIAKTSSYVAVGWRPNDIDMKCKQIPMPPVSQSKSNKPELRKSKELSGLPLVTRNFTIQNNKTGFMAESATNEIPQPLLVSVVGTKSLQTQTPMTTETPIKTISVSSSPRIRFPPRKPILSHRGGNNHLTTRSTATEKSTITSTTSFVPLTEQVQNSEKSDHIKVVTKISSEVNTEQETAEARFTSSEWKSSEEQTTESSESVGEINSASTEEISQSSVITNEDMEAMASEEVEQLSNVEVKSYGPEGPKSKRDTKENLPIPANPFQLGEILHPMDCTDMVIGSARGDYSRIGDYYSYDLSTPHMDTFWNGQDNLMTAFGFESNNITVIKFRKKLIASEKTDHSISNTTMHFIWAVGQVDNFNMHLSTTPSVSLNQTFYTPDDLKYHGSQRGATTLNFYMDNSKLSSPNSCRGEWKTPSKCVASDCEYKAVWEYQPATDRINFTIFTNHTNTWTGIGFSKDARMNNSDAIIGWVNDDNKLFLMDTWISGYFSPKLDKKQDIADEAGQRNASGTTLKFSRQRDTADTEEDLAFTNSECLYLIFPHHGGPYNGINKKIKKHEKTPAISSRRICIQACKNAPEVMTESTFEQATDETTDIRANEFTVVTLSSPPAVTTVYMLTIKLPYEEPQNIINRDEIMRILRLKIRSEVSSILKDVNGFKDIEVTNTDSETNRTNWLYAKMKIHVNDNLMDFEDDYMLQQIINNSVADGKIGLLRVDPSYYLLELPERFVRTSTVFPDVVESASSGHLMAIYAIIAAVSALGLLLFTQIISMICKYRNNQSTRVSKEQLIANSGWKDYSTTASSNYSYEPFSSHYDESTGKISKNPIGGSYRGANSNRNGQPTSTNSNVAAPVGDSRSLRRHNRPEGDQNHYSRRSESLPRLSPNPQVAPRGNDFNNHDRFYHDTVPRSPMELQPDFYFMPSQRRYKDQRNQMTTLNQNNMAYMDKM